MEIAIGNARTDKTWKNIEITWEAFASKVSQTIRTAESVSEFKQLPKAQKDEA